MNLSNFAIWLKCFWAVVFPNWWTLALVIAALAAFGIMKLVYAKHPVGEKGALQRVGKRWRMVGLIMLAAALVVYVVELIAVNAATVDLFANREKLNKDDVTRVLYKNEHDFARYCAANRARMKTHEDVDAVKEKFPVRSQMSYADKARVDLALTFSKYLADTGNQRFYPAPECAPNRELKRDTVDKVIKQLDLASAEDARHKTLTDAAKNEFTAKENREALERLKALMTSEFSKDPVNVNYSSSSSNWAQEKKTTKSAIKNNTAKLRDELIKEKIARVDAIFNQPVNPESRSSVAFEFYLASIHNEINTQIYRELEDMFSTDNFWALRNEIIAKLEREPGFKKQSFNRQLEQFNIRLREELSRQWQARVEAIINRNIAKWETEALLYNDDQLSYQQLKADQKSLNGSLVVLYKSSCCLHDLFWLLLLAIAALFVFWIRGSKIVRAGSLSTIKRKINKA